MQARETEERCANAQKSPVTFCSDECSVTFAGWEDPVKVLPSLLYIVPRCVLIFSQNRFTPRASGFRSGSFEAG